MAKGNGKKLTLGFTIFTIGGEEYRVPALNLFVLEQCQDEINALGPDLTWIEYAQNSIRIIRLALEDAYPDLTYEALSRVCSVPEMRGLIPSMTELLRTSGFLMGEAEATAESPGIGTLSPPSPNLQPTESAAATLNE